jgi:hypothetical protein
VSNVDMLVFVSAEQMSWVELFAIWI